MSVHRSTKSSRCKQYCGYSMEAEARTFALQGRCQRAFAALLAAARALARHTLSLGAVMHREPTLLPGHSVSLSQVWIVEAEFCQG